MIAITIWNDGEKKRFWVKEVPEEESDSIGKITINRLFDWWQDERRFGGNRILIDRLVNKDVCTSPPSIP